MTQVPGVTYCLGSGLGKGFLVRSRARILPCQVPAQPTHTKFSTHHVRRYVDTPARRPYSVCTRERTPVVDSSIRSPLPLPLTPPFVVFSPLGQHPHQQHTAHGPILLNVPPFIATVYLRHHLFHLFGATILSSAT